MSDGSFDEDFLKESGDLGGYRSLNHFYDPFNKQGLSDWPAFGNPVQYGRDSFTWVLTETRHDEARYYFTTTINNQFFTFIVTFANESGTWKIRNF